MEVTHPWVTLLLPTHLEAMGNNVPVTYWATAGGDPLSAHESRSFKHFKWTPVGPVEGWRKWDGRAVPWTLLKFSMNKQNCDFIKGLNILFPIDIEIYGFFSIQVEFLECEESFLICFATMRFLICCFLYKWLSSILHVLWFVKAFVIFLVYPSPKSCWLLDNMHLQDLSHVGMKPSGVSGIKQKQFFAVHFVKNWLMCVMDSNGKISGAVEGPTKQLAVIL